MNHPMNQDEDSNSDVDNYIAEISDDDEKLSDLDDFDEEQAT